MKKKPNPRKTESIYRELLYKYKNVQVPSIYIFNNVSNIDHSDILNISITCIHSCTFCNLGEAILNSVDYYRFIHNIIYHS